MSEEKNGLVQALEKLIESGLSFGDAMNTFAAKRDAIDLAFVKEAKKQASEGSLEVDENAATSRSDDTSGAYVQAWIWVRATLPIKKAVKAHPEVARQEA